MISQTKIKEWIFLSPHFDDAALSCGGLISHLTTRGADVKVLTICAGDAPQDDISEFAHSIHLRWDLDSNPPASRRVEDELACQRLGADAVHLTLPDCIYRKSPVDDLPLYTSEEALFGPLDPAEKDLVEWVAGEIRSRMADSPNLVCPMTVGGHVDHRLTRAAAELLGRELYYYADYPYVLADNSWLESGVPSLVGPDWAVITAELSDTNQAAWEDAVAAYVSQIAIFWQDEGGMRAAIRDYYQTTGTARLWRQTPSSGK